MTLFSMHSVVNQGIRKLEIIDKTTVVFALDPRRAGGGRGRLLSAERHTHTAPELAVAAAGCGGLDCRCCAVSGCPACRRTRVSAHALQPSARLLLGVVAMAGESGVVEGGRDWSGVVSVV